jgi:hypothetical protein
VAIVVAVLLGAFALAFVLYPLYQKEIPSMDKESPSINRAPSINRGATARRLEHAASPLPGDITVQQEDREESARAALQEVEFDFQLGNLGEDDYRSLRERYMRRALSALKSRHDRERALDDAIEEQVRKLREIDEDTTT